MLHRGASGGAAMLLLLALFGLVAVASAAEQADGRTSGGVLVYKAASTCCAGCSYRGGCCCAPRDKLPVTSTKVKFIKTRTITQKKVSTVTRTSFKTVTKTIAKRDLGALSNVEVAVSAERFALIGAPKPRLAKSELEGAAEVVKRELEPAVDQAEVQIDEPVGDLFARAAGRKLCPVCPKGVKVQGKTGAGGTKYCCPARKTVYKTVKKTSTKLVATSTKVIRKTATKTRTARKLVIRVFQDVDKNGKYNKPPDVPLAAGKKLALSNKSRAKRLQSRQEVVCNVISVAMSTSTGEVFFGVPIDEIAPGDDIVIYDYEECVEYEAAGTGAPEPDPLAEFTINADGTLPTDIPTLLIDYETPSLTPTDVTPTMSLTTKETLQTLTTEETLQTTAEPQTTVAPEVTTAAPEPTTTNAPTTQKTTTKMTTTHRTHTTTQRATARAKTTLTFELSNKTSLTGCSDTGSTEVKATQSNSEGSWTLRFYNPAAVNTTPAAPAAKFFCSDTHGLDIGIFPGNAADTSLPASFYIELTNTSATAYYTGIMTGLGYSRGNYTMTQYNEIYDANSKGILLYRFLTADGIPNGDTGSAGVGNFTLSGSDLMPLKFYYNDPCNATDTFAACTQMADEATQKAFSWTLSMIKVLPANVF